MSKIARSFFASLRKIIHQKNAKEVLVGTDDLGNKYYERLADPEKGLKQLRRVEPMHHASDASIVPDVPAEWMTWLQERRQHPPTPEEVYKNQQILLKTLRRAEELERSREHEDLQSEVKKDSESSAPTGINFPVYDDLMPNTQSQKKKTDTGLE